MDWEHIRRLVLLVVIVGMILLHFIWEAGNATLHH